jgi:hypothetical protein
VTGTTQLSANLVPTSTLFDTGAGKSYLDPVTASKLSDTPRRFSKPMPVYQFDGSAPSSGPIVKYVDTYIVFFNRSTVLPICLIISTLFAPGIVIGDEWMARNRTVIDLHNRKISITPYKAHRSTSINIQVPLPAGSPSPSSTLVEEGSTTGSPKSAAPLDTSSLPSHSQVPPTIVAALQN